MLSRCFARILGSLPFHSDPVFWRLHIVVLVRSGYCPRGGHHSWDGDCAKLRHFCRSLRSAPSTQMSFTSTVSQHSRQPRRSLLATNHAFCMFRNWIATLTLWSVTA